jgi:glycosyl transferase family 9 (putative heptosyltransferase)
MREIPGTFETMTAHVQASALAISVKRCRGLGNVVMLLPVLDRLVEQGTQVHLVTRTEWVDTLQELRANISIDDRCRADTIDLDAATESLKPGKHRSAEFADILGVADTIDASRINVPEEWSLRFHPWRGAVGFAPEAGHASREWPIKYSVALGEALRDSPLILIGANAGPPIPCALDTRGQLDLKELLGLFRMLRLLICMDSGVLHLGAAMGVPTISIFGGVNPRHRIAATQQVIALQARLDCCPCDKQETCDGAFDCIKAISPQMVLDAIKEHPRISERTVRRIG